jgi:ribosome biogenesis GTPase A
MLHKGANKVMKKFKKKDRKINYNKGEQIHDDVNLNHINWFPGHMNKAIRKIKERLKSVDIVLEVRDARAPLATGNSELTKIFAQKGHLILFNKENLADETKLGDWKKWFEQQETPYYFFNGLEKNDVQQIIGLAKEVVQKKRLQSNPDGKFKKNFKMMVVGLPNTGKSTIINTMANRNASKVANKPGQTQQQLWVKVGDQLTVLDTPGVMPPKIIKHEHGIWLTALHAIPDTVVAPEIPACYLIEYFLKKESEEFKSRYKLERLDLELIQALDQIAINMGCLQKGGFIDYDRVYKIVLGDFRKGVLGKVTFGTPPKLYSNGM